MEHSEASKLAGSIQSVNELILVRNLVAVKDVKEITFGQDIQALWNSRSKINGKVVLNQGIKVECKLSQSSASHIGSWLTELLVFHILKLKYVVQSCHKIQMKNIVWKRSQDDHSSAACNTFQG